MRDDVDLTRRRADALARAYAHWRQQPKRTHAVAAYRVLRKEFDLRLELARTPPTPKPARLFSEPPAQVLVTKRRHTVAIAIAAAVAVVLFAVSVVSLAATRPQHAVPSVVLAPPVTAVETPIHWRGVSTRVMHAGPPCTTTWRHTITIANGAQYARQIAVVALSGTDYKRPVSRRVAVDAHGVLHLDVSVARCAPSARDRAALVSIGSNAAVVASDS